MRPQHGEQYQRDPLKGTSLCGNTSSDVYIVKTRPRMQAGRDNPAFQWAGQPPKIAHSIGDLDLGPIRVNPKRHHEHDQQTDTSTTLLRLQQ